MNLELTGLGIATAAEIDASNILVASLRAMARAVARLTHAPDHILVDGNRLPDWAHAAEAVVGGDARAPAREGHGCATGRCDARPVPLPGTARVGRVPDGRVGKVEDS